MGIELGYVIDVGAASCTLAIESAARGPHEDAVRAIAEAKRLGAIAGVDGVAVQVHLVEAFCALCRGDYPLVVTILEQRIAVDDGGLPRVTTRSRSHQTSSRPTSPWAAGRIGWPSQPDMKPCTANPRIRTSAPTSTASPE